MISAVFCREQRIIHALLLYGGFCENDSLMHGKMGIAILFYHLHQKFRRPEYENFADDLIDDICQNPHSQECINLESGIAGIGYGLEYLIQHNFLDTDEDINTELDYFIYQEWQNGKSRNPDFSCGTGGLLLYYLTRLQNKRISGPQRYFITTHLHEMAKEWLKKQQATPYGNIFDLAGRPADIYIAIQLIKNCFLVPELCTWIKTQLLLPISQKSCLCLIEMLICSYIHKNNLFQSETKSRIVTLKSQITRPKIREEFNHAPLTWRYGCSGITFLYAQLAKWQAIPEFLTESNYWQQYVYNADDQPSILAGYTHFPEKKQYGLSEGLASILYCTLG